jgi:hypothetical protein
MTTFQMIIPAKTQVASIFVLLFGPIRRDSTQKAPNLPKKS